MAGKKRDKDHLHEHAGVELVATILPPSDDGDPLRWWTQHPSEAAEIDLNVFADGQMENPFGTAGLASMWKGPFSGRPGLIQELAVVLRARSQFQSGRWCENYLTSLRAWWRLFDKLEATPLPGDQRLARLDSVAALNAFHEAGAHQEGMTRKEVSQFRSLANDARKALGLRRLYWVTPKNAAPVRQLISDKMAKALKIAMKRNWVAVLRGWQLRDRVRVEATRRDRGEPEERLGPEGELLIVNWREFQRIAQATGEILPSREQLLDGRTPLKLNAASFTQTTMRAIQFPTVWEMEVAYHLALLDSGWNPSTLSNLDASDPNCVARSLKDQAYLVLHAEEAEGSVGPPNQDGTGPTTLSISAPKPRAGGKLQICHGLAKNSCSAPTIVRVFLARSEQLRAVLRDQLTAAIAEHTRLLKSGADRQELGEVYRRVLHLRRGVSNVWTCVDPSSGEIRWMSSIDKGCRYSVGNRGVGYVAKVADTLSKAGQPMGDIVRSDLRDLHARSVLRASGGSVIAVMLALGHSRLANTVAYLENNLFRDENDKQVRQFMDHLFGELELGRVDLAILAQLTRHGPLTAEMEARLLEYRALMKSRCGVGCSEPRRPPSTIDPMHVAGRYCTVQRCGLCSRARFLPESLDGLAMRAEELLAIGALIPREAWLRLKFDAELENIESIVAGYYEQIEVATARDKWRDLIANGLHRIPGIQLQPSR